MTGFNESDVRRDADGRFDEKPQSAPEATLTLNRDLTTETPENIDTELAELYNQAWLQRAKAETARKTAQSYQKQLDRISSEFDERLYGERYRGARARAETEAAEHDAQVEALTAQMQPFEDEFARRGGWERAFLVTGGHLHRSMNCSTCNRDGKATRFAWMTEYSGRDEDSIVEDAGDRACTTCYPSAPVESLGRASKMFTPDEEEAERQRAERLAEKERRAADKAAKAITAPDGSELVGPYTRPRTLVTAERDLVDTLMWDYDASAGQAFKAEQAEWANTLITAIAHKKGISEDEVRQAAQVKAERKYNRR